MKKPKITNEAKNLTRLAGEFLVASRLTHRGYMVALQWGTTIGYDILVFDKSDNVAFLEVKSTASHPRRWMLQKKYASISSDKKNANRFVCCVDLTSKNSEPIIHVFPGALVAEALRYFYGEKFSKSDSYVLALDSRPRGRAKDANAKTVGEFLSCDDYREKYQILNVKSLE